MLSNCKIKIDTKWGGGVGGVVWALMSQIFLSTLHIWLCQGFLKNFDEGGKLNLKKTSETRFNFSYLFYVYKHVKQFWFCILNVWMFVILRFSTFCECVRPASLSISFCCRSLSTSSCCRSVYLDSHIDSLGKCLTDSLGKCLPTP